jgi:hypothetical protein
MIKFINTIKFASLFGLGLVILIATILSPLQFILAANGDTNDTGKSGSYSKDDQWTDSFPLNKCTFTSIGNNQYFILRPGYQTVYEGVDDGIDVWQTITVLNETRSIHGIDARIIEEKSGIGQVRDDKLNLVRYGFLK